METLLKVKEIDVDLVTKNGIALHLACKEGFFDLSILLLYVGADPLKKDQGGLNALQYCSSE